MGISAVIITYNEEANIERCLQSLSFVDEIVVLDSFSTDATMDIVRRHTDKVAQRKFAGFAEQRNAAIELASHEWIFVVDADEVVTPELASDIGSAVVESRFDAYRMRRLTYFLGKPIRHCGWYPDYGTRVFRKTKARFDDSLVHEGLLLSGPVGQLKNELLHYSYRDMDDVMRKMFGYTRAAALQRYRKGQRAKLSDLLFRPGLTFLRKFIVQQGFRDGLRGFIVCMLAQCGVFLRYAALWEMSLQKEQDRDR